MPTEKFQRVDQKNGVIGQVITFTPGVIVIKMSKNGSFFIFSADDNERSVTVWGKYLGASERSCLALSESYVDY